MPDKRFPGVAADYCQKWKNELAAAPFIAAQQKRTLFPTEQGMTRQPTSGGILLRHTPELKETLMKVTTAASIALLSLGLASAGIARADQANYPEITTPSTQSRAGVVQALRVAQSQGLVIAGEQGSYPGSRAEAPALTRAQVLNELKQAKSAGLLTIGDRGQYPRML